MLESKLSSCLCASLRPTPPHVATQSYQADAGGFPRAGRIPVVLLGCLTEEGRSRGEAEGSSGLPRPAGTHRADSRPCPVSAEAARHSPSPNIYHEAGRGILSSGTCLGSHGGKQVGFVSQKLLRSRFLPETICFMQSKGTSVLQFVALFKMGSLLVPHTSVC